MIQTPDGTILRNLQEQVEQNKQDIAAHYNIDRVLADFGIKVVGQVASVNLLPDPDTYKGDYGDAYAVGASEPYDFYIWTRADVDAGHPKDYWFNIGRIAIIGPEGPQGIQGEKGDPGRPTKVVPVYTLPKSKGELERLGLHEGDYALPADQPGKLFYLYSDVTIRWDYVLYIIGPKGDPGERGLDGKDGEKGDPGPKGETGDVGGFVNIRAILTSQEQLPDPKELKDLTAAYLIGTENPRDLYIQVGYTSDVAVWTNTGPFNAATLVMVGGKAQNVWDADTKLNRLSATGFPQLYAMNAGGGDYSYKVAASYIEGGTIPGRTSDGQIKAADPISDNEVETKGHSSRTYLKQATEKYIVYGTNAQGAQTTVQYNQVPYGSGIAQRMSDGRLKANSPSEDDDCANKQYVDLLHMADDARLGALEDSVTDLDNQIAEDRFVMTNVQNMTEEKKLQARENIDVKKLVSTAKEEVTIPEIIDIDTFRTYFYNMRKNEQRHFQFEISNGGMHYELMSILGYPEGVSTATQLFLYIDLPYSEAGGFEIDLTLMGRNTSEYFKREMHSTLNSSWKDSGWYETATKAQLNSLSMASSTTIDNMVFTPTLEYNTFIAPSNGWFDVQVLYKQQESPAAVQIVDDIFDYIRMANIGRRASGYLPKSKGQTFKVYIEDLENIESIQVKFIHAKEV